MKPKGVAFVLSRRRFDVLPDVDWASTVVLGRNYTKREAIATAESQDCFLYEITWTWTKHHARFSRKFAEKFRLVLEP